jgi:outer membrane biosynthesis protein TonB
MVNSVMNLVLKDNLDQIVRSFRVQNSETLNVVLLNEQKRISIEGDLKQLTMDDVDFTLLQSVSASSLKTKDLKINANLSLAILDSNHQSVPALEMKPEDDRSVVLAYKWSAMAHASVLGGLFLLGFIYTHYFAPEKPTPVMEVIVLPKLEEKILPPPPKPIHETPKKIVKVAVAKTPVVKKIQPKVVKPLEPKVQKIVKVVKPTISQGIKQSQHTEIGTLKTLAKLGGIGADTQAKNKGTGSGSSLNGAFGSGKNGSGGGLGSGLTGGLRDGLMGKGLVGGLSGAGSQSYGAHGYGQGKFGGGRTGHGGASLGQRVGDIVVPAFNDSEIVGGLTREQVEAVVRRNQGQLLFCYEKALQSSPKLRGRITSQWVVGPAGSVTSAKVASTTLNNSEVESCVTRSIKGWKFPRPVGGVHVDVSYPFDFGRLNLMAKED